MNEYPIKTDEHIIHNWEPLNTTVDEHFNYISKNIVSRFFGVLLALLAFIVLYPLNSILFGIKVRGRKNLRKVRGGGIIVANHVHPMDCTFLLTHGTAPRRPYIVSTKGAFDIPVVRRMIKLLRAVPVPRTFAAKRSFLDAINSVAGKNLVLVFPEAAVWPYYEKLRPFKIGAFSFAVKNDVPIIPACVTFRQPNKLYHIFGRKKPLITITYLTPIVARGTERELRDVTYDKMNEHIKKSNELSKS